MKKKKDHGTKLANANDTLENFEKTFNRLKSAFKDNVSLVRDCDFTKTWDLVRSLLLRDVLLGGVPVPVPVCSPNGC